MVSTYLKSAGMCDNLTTLGYYFKSIGWDLMAFIISVFAVYAIFVAFPRYWLKWWAEDTEGRIILYTTGYLLLSLGVSVSKYIAIGSIVGTDVPNFQALLSNFSYITSVATPLKEQIYAQILTLILGLSLFWLVPEAD